MARKMTTKAAEPDKARARRRAKNELEIKAKYEGELAALDANSSPPEPRSLSWLPSDAPLEYPVISQPKASYFTGQASLLVVSFDSDSDTSSQISDVVGEKDVFASKRVSLRSPSPTSRQSGRIRKPTRKIESQRRRATEGESEPKKKKFRKTKSVGVTSQLKELFGSDIEFST